ncbi:hypothetical protein AC249_AIPGENE7869 [Exaiptasia diaphana]|nr:hypothetical protein AC249_AIPGENE7869 [Exaiptasia diaphana]
MTCISTPIQSEYDFQYAELLPDSHQHANLLDVLNNHKEWDKIVVREKLVHLKDETLVGKKQLSIHPATVRVWNNTKKFATLTNTSTERVQDFEELQRIALSDKDDEAEELYTATIKEISTIQHIDRFLKQSMTWTEEHDTLLCREILFIDPFTGTKKGTPARGQKWREVADNLLAVDRPRKKESLSKKLEDFTQGHKEYVAHQVRTKHQADYYRYVTANIKAGELVVIIDYKMKLELGKRLRENQREWFGKRGVSIHGFFVMAKIATGDTRIEVVDLWSDDTKQDAWFTQSALDVGFRWLEETYPGFSVYLFSAIWPMFQTKLDNWNGSSLQAKIEEIATVAVGNYIKSDDFEEKVTHKIRRDLQYHLNRIDDQFKRQDDEIKKQDDTTAKRECDL